MSTTKIVALFSAGMFVSGCSVFTAVKQPEQKNLGVLTEGTHQSLVRAELGQDDQGNEIPLQKKSKE